MVFPSIALSRVVGGTPQRLRGEQPRAAQSTSFHWSLLYGQRHTRLAPRTSSPFFHDSGVGTALAAGCSGRGATGGAGMILHKTIENGDGRLALSLLKHLDLTRDATAGPTDPDLVEGEIAILEEEQRHRLHERAFDAGNSHLSPTHIDWKKELQERREKRAGKNQIDPAAGPESGGNGEAEPGA